MISADIIVRLDIDAERMTPEIKDALESLAAVMLVQAEDGLYSSGNPDDDHYLVQVSAEAPGTPVWEERPNEHLADFTRTTTKVVAR